MFVYFIAAIAFGRLASYQIQDWKRKKTASNIH